MSGRWTWILAGSALAAGWFGYGWRGIVLALSVIAFWLLLEFSRTMRVLRRAAQAPLGHVASAVMLQSKLSKGMPLADIIKLAGSLGQKVRDEPETFAWRDGGGAAVEVEFQAGRCRGWNLLRAPDQA
jgi:hypothetical protein